MAEEKTTDNQVVSLRLATMIALIFGVASLSFTISGIIFNITRIEEQVHKLDERITKTTGRNAAEIKELKDANK